MLLFRNIKLTPFTNGLVQEQYAKTLLNFILFMEDLNVPIFDINDISDPMATKIIEFLYLGDEQASKDSILLDELKIKRIVNVEQE